MLSSTFIGLVICLVEHPEIIAQLSLRAAAQMRPQTSGVKIDSALLGEQIAEKLADKSMLELLDSPEFRAIADRVLGKPPEPTTRPGQDQTDGRFDFQDIMTGPPWSEQPPEVAAGSAQSESEPPRKITDESRRPKEVPGEAAWPSPIRRNEFVD